MKKNTKPQIVISNSQKVITEKAANSRVLQFPIVGIGASAGGLEALELFFKHMPPASGMAFVVIQHLDPNYKGMMPELLQSFTPMQVFTATDRLRVNPNSIYVIPPNKSLTIRNRSLYLSEPIEIRGLRLPVDCFFSSLADDQKEKSIGVILSGMGSDGSWGVKAIKEKAGLVLIQDPASAKFDSMPNSAIEAALVDVVASADKLPAKLMALINHTVQEIRALDMEQDTSSLDKIIILLRNQTGNDFSQYKKNTIYRRIERRMSVHQLDKIGLYANFLQENPSEVDILYKELLIGVTNFFRDTVVWDALRDVFIPSIINNQPNGQVVRAWVPGCSTGEEAYSLAIVFKEAMEKVKSFKNITLQIFATDLDSVAIEKARKGIFPATIKADVSSQRLERYFIKDNDSSYRVNALIREMVIFACQNAIKDPPFTRLDIITCRNMLIYLNAELQKKLLSLFHYSLKSGGLLLLGIAETDGAQSEMFSTIDSKLRVYQRTGIPNLEGFIDFPDSSVHIKPAIFRNNTKAEMSENIQALTHELLLQQFTPASILVTEMGDIMYITGSTGKYLEPAAGKANMNLFAMARDGLRNELPGAFRKALQSHEKIVLPNLKVETFDKIQVVNVTIQQIEKPLVLKGRILVIFQDVLPNPVKGSLVKKKPKSLTSSDQADLELELQRLKEDLLHTHEDMQTSQEELKSTNEELQSTNEELQSSNEELTTSKEETQSLNEELYTVNAELQSKVADYERVNNDMNNLLNSIEIPTLFLDNELNIRQFTIPATRIFKIRPSDIGRPFTDQVTDLDYPEMYTDAKKVLSSLIFLEHAVPTSDGRWYSIRMMPYRTVHDNIDGLVITFIEITKSKKLEFELLESQRMLRELIQSVSGVVIGLSAEGLVVEFNPHAEKLFGRKRKDVLDKNYIDLFIVESSQEMVKEDMKKLLEGNSPNRYVNHVKSVNGEQLVIEWVTHKLYDDHGAVTGLINIGANIEKLKTGE